MQADIPFSKPVEQVIRKRYSCRAYALEPIEDEKKRNLLHFIRDIGSGPFGNSSRFTLISATPSERNSLKGLGTYGFIRDASGFIIGAVDKKSQRNLEDFGYLMEKVILRVTEMGLGTCWLGGTFTKSSFGRKAAVQEGEMVPAVAAVGNPGGGLRWIERLFRHRADAERRLPWESLFFRDGFSQTLAKTEAGDYCLALEMVRLAPSASNKQPWRVVKSGGAWHFFLKRTPGYRESTLVRLFTVADMQRIDMGIAMCHFELSLREARLAGEWGQLRPAEIHASYGTEYIASWIGSSI
ncbi:MAG: hypothetical protein A2Z16_08120 [Chloroflexi bacterium RBG_16_54_18]|nr:MAG: hypothetical protein A2Z16_08120 [Chloroflexi bacterium RBG_16_54_18]